MAETSKAAGTITPIRVASLSSSSSVEEEFGVILIVAPKRDFWIYSEGSEIVRPVQESGELGSAELVISRKCEV